VSFHNAILQNEVLGLPEIGESDIPTWLASVKVVLSDLVGFDEGPYYDLGLSRQKQAEMLFPAKYGYAIGPSYEFISPNIKFI
jgi:hypothetical protein